MPLAQGLADPFDAIGRMVEAIVKTAGDPPCLIGSKQKNGGDGRVAHGFMPAADRELAGDEGVSVSVAFVDGQPGTGRVRVWQTRLPGWPSRHTCCARVQAQSSLPAPDSVRIGRPVGAAPML